MTRAGTGLADRLRAGRTRRVVALPLLAAGTGLIALAALSIGAVPVPSGRVLAVLAGRGDPADALVLLQVRLPRLVAGLLVGAALAVSGALMQSLFRNPLADPGLIGVSAGASLAAGLTIVLGDALLAPWIGALPVWILPAGAFAGGLATTALLYAIATRHGTAPPRSARSCSRASASRRWRAR
jgi:iron complex transport system permease protein